MSIEEVMSALADEIGPYSSAAEALLPDMRAGKSFRELGVTSLQVVEMLVSLEEKFAIDFMELELAENALISPLSLATAIADPRPASGDE